eukprot:CAMPEP_0177439956 /NCGR_PEP_ID=MMETSP0369-20130122/3594_1 /TAXON_ID=447022 ORGANISM="Scrippsiella hangoei-like, Strain SHHI-4" /NCGR_SAMPLE_ID=MMETSP0369 /ASSEMBLY_ACC=CAM_ASM_000364 /LENGTH=117 /DNA_ID=CAMNT_0018911683 /DNA_START=445 /DNA_END=799 /DNA_ORIENTATION=-
MNEGLVEDEALALRPVPASAATLNPWRGLRARPLALTVWDDKAEVAAQHHVQAVDVRLEALLGACRNTFTLSGASQPDASTSRTNPKVVCSAAVSASALEVGLPKSLSVSIPQPDWP